MTTDSKYFYGGTYRQQAAARAANSPSYVTYRELPSNYSGDAYYYNNRYYAGGRYEPGTYSYRGQTYDHRYFYNGQYFYGGDYRRALSRTSPTPVYRTPRW